MSDLSQSLIDAVAGALRVGCFVDPDDDTLPRFHDKAALAVVAVLETLAVEELRRYMDRDAMIDLRELASEVRASHV